jgi:glycosyltransferase involved in cell wall biosynthesis
MPTREISVLIPTFNEELNIERCLRACSWSDDITVFDSFSTDRTVEIAKDFGARVIQRKWDSELGQRTAMLQVPFKYRWVFNPDADEVATPEFCQEMFQLVGEASDDVAVFRMRRKDIFQGKWIRHSSVDAWFGRLWVPSLISFERLINTVCIAHGKDLRMNERLIHYAFEKGLDDWFAKHNHYSKVEAQIALASLEKPMPKLSEFFSSDLMVSRLALKELFARLPGRPIVRFVYMYVWRRGFLDGRAGLNYCLMVAFYEFMIVLKAQAMLDARKH